MWWRHGDVDWGAGLEGYIVGRDGSDAPHGFVADEEMNKKDLKV